MGGRGNNSRRLATVPTVTIPLDRSPKPSYPDAPCIQKFLPNYDLAASGINVPKIVKCMGTDGKEYKQLCKLDDTRPDAVMEQFFVTVNKLLQTDAESRQRNLSMRTYNVTPLAQNVGVIEFVGNTMALAMYLLSAHTRYGKMRGDWDKHRCQEMLKKEKEKEKQKGKQQSSKLLSIYRDITANFHPIFHHYFLENFPDPPQWFQNRLNYTRSVAVNSMVGHIMGLGDRHVNNILIDKSTGELVHIDFGITFEMGKILPTPETVPFRLTRDIVDGMGINGCEGAFIRCCESTLRVLRSNEDLLMTLGEVLVHDPLKRWSINPEFYTREREDDDAGPDNDAPQEEDGEVLARNFLSRLREKLQGRHGSATHSVEGQVKHLIGQATRPENLCMMFHGWQAYL